MKAFQTIPIVLLGAASALFSQEVSERARQMERSGDASNARQMLQRAARNAPDNPAVWAAYAEFLDRYRDPAARAAYEKLLGALGSPADRQNRAQVARRLVLLDLVAGDRAAAVRHLGEYRSSGGQLAQSPLPFEKGEAAAEEHPTMEIPGPLPSFLRMAAVSQDVGPPDLLPALARNVITNGYQASTSSEALEPTEYMKLLQRYVSQARELEKLAGAEKTIRIEACESPRTGELLRVLGYRIRGACGSEVVLETVNATRAFLTIDSGFPLAELEQVLRTNRPFVYDYHPTLVPVLYGPDYWVSPKEKQAGSFIDVFLNEPAVCRLYLGLSKLDRTTANALKGAVPMQRLRPFAHVLDFFGGMFEIRDGKAVAPGGARTARAWADLVGVSPDQGAAFFERLITKDDGWMASFFDALSRVNGPVKEYLTQPERMRRFYMAVRGRVTSPGPARPVFRSNTDMMLLTTRLRLEADGRPHVPGNLDVWKNLFINHPHGKYDGRLTRLATTWKEPDDIIEALFALCRKSVENEPLKIFMALSDLNRHRFKPLEPATVDRLAREYRGFGAQYTIFGEAPSLSDATMLLFLDTARGINRIGDMQLRANTAGTMQALIGLWQIFCRQGAIPEDQADKALSGILSGFTRLRNSRELFDAGRAGVKLLLSATGSPEDVRAQDRSMELLAGVSRPSDSDSQSQVVQEMIRLFEAQRLVSLDTLLELADHLDSIARGGKMNPALINRLASRIAEIQLPRASLTTVEKNAFAYGYWTERHIEAQRRVNLRAAIERAGSVPERLRDIRGQLADFLRDTLVGLNYIHYAPPGGQCLQTNPLFVRSHDFLGVQGNLQTWRHTEVLGTGWPSNAGGRLEGSLSGLAYALAEAEQNFMVPAREQALIWGDLVPQMILTAKVPRWWNVTRAQMHWVGLHMRYAESLLAEAVLDPGRRGRVREILEGQAAPGRLHKVMDLLAHGDVRTALDNVTPAELFVLASETVAREQDPGSMLAGEIRRLQRESPDHINYRAISRAFGTPKPTLTSSYQPELLHLRTFPTLMGYSSRIMAESWESNALFWAALADEVHLPPARLNLLIPQWTQRTVEKIFATHLEDWPALLRSMRLVGEDVRLEMREQAPAEQKASLE